LKHHEEDAKKSVHYRFVGLTAQLGIETSDFGQIGAFGGPQWTSSDSFLEFLLF
jgi:hypothetical protein